MEVESCKNPVSKHLPEKVVRACTQGMHTPTNPHSQRLLTAEARSAGKVPKSDPKKKAEPKRKGNEPKKPNKVESKPEPSASSGPKKRVRRSRKSRQIQVFLAVNMLPPRKSSCFFFIGVHSSLYTHSLDHDILIRLLRLAPYTQKVKEQW